MRLRALVAAGLALGGLTATLAPTAPAAASAAAGANLVVTAVSSPPAVGREGDRFAVRDTVANRGTGPAGASETRYYLSPDPTRSLAERRAASGNPRLAATDILLGGARRVPALAAGAASTTPRSPKVEVAIPVGTPPGLYALLACADDRGAVAESAEQDDCKPARRKITIVADEAEPQVGALSGLFPPPADSLADTLQAVAPALCAAPPTPARRLTTAAALASIRRFLETTAGKPALQAFLGSPEARTADAAEAAAGAAILIGEPGAALAALVRAQQLDPREASRLVDLAGVAVTVGLPNEALALLDGAARLDDRGGTPLGISRRAIALTVRGQALALLGRNAEAQKALAAARAAAPLLTEAAQSLALPTLCTGGSDEALPLVQARRVQETVDPAAAGVALSLRPLELPGFPRQAAGMREFAQQLALRLGQESIAYSQREGELGGRVRAADQTVQPAERDRRYGIMRRFYAAHETPEAKARYDALVAKLRQVVATDEEFWGGGTGEVESRYVRFLREASDACLGVHPYDPCFTNTMREKCRPALNIAHQTWLDQMEEAYALAQAYYRALSRDETGIAAYLADPDAHAYALLQVQLLERNVFALVQQPTISWTQDVWLHADHCVESPEPTTSAQPEASAIDGPSCPEVLNKLDLVLEVGPAKLKTNCERVQLGISLEVVPWLGAFGEINYDARVGKMTVYAGSKGEIKAPGGFAKLGFKSGVYVETIRGQVSDVGWRVGPSATVGKGPLELTVKDTEDISFVGALSATFGL